MCHILTMLYSVSLVSTQHYKWQLSYIGAYGTDTVIYAIWILVYISMFDTEYRRFLTYPIILCNIVYNQTHCLDSIKQLFYCRIHFCFGKFQQKRLFLHMGIIEIKKDLFRPMPKDNPRQPRRNLISIGVLLQRFAANDESSES